MLAYADIKILWEHQEVVDAHTSVYGFAFKTSYEPHIVRRVFQSQGYESRLSFRGALRVLDIHDASLDFILEDHSL